jgi:hypothetical protein
MGYPVPDKFLGPKQILFLCSCRSGIPPLICPECGDKKSRRGVKGTLPLGCLPLWGREGVTLPFSAENKLDENGFNRAQYPQEAILLKLQKHNTRIFEKKES